MNGRGQLTGAISTEVNCPGVIVRGAIALVVIVWRVIFREAIDIGGNCPGADCLGGNCHGGQLFEENCPGGY